MLSVSPFRIGFDPQERETKRRDEDENGIGDRRSQPPSDFLTVLCNLT